MTTTHLPPATDRDAERRQRTVGDLIAQAIAGDEGALAELERRGGPSVIDEWLQAVDSREHAKRRELAAKLEKLRGGERIAVALATLSNARHA